MKKIYYSAFIILIICIFSFDINQFPKAVGYVNDFENIYTENKIIRLNSK